MKPLEDNELDALFKIILKVRNRKMDFTDHSWNVMEALLAPKQPAKRKVIWINWVAGAAAMLLLFLGWQWQMSGQTPQNKIAKVALCVSNGPEHHEVTAAPINSMVKSSTMAHIARQTSRKNATPVDKYNIHPVTEQASRIAPVLFTHAGSTISEVKIGLSAGLTLSDSLKGHPLLASTIDTPETAKARSVLIKKLDGAGQRLTLSVLAAPDVNGVNSLSGGRTGSNFAVQLTLKLTNRLRISSGVAYASKSYQTGFNNYMSKNPAWWASRSATATPDNVVADCRVLDIPLNINYQLYHKGANSLLLGTGLSSYFMLRENYRFNFADPNTSPVNLDLSNANQHLLGILNFNATYQHQLSDQLGLLLQPYYKLPLTRIGAGQVDLKSAGIAVGVSWNFHAFNNK